MWNNNNNKNSYVDDAKRAFLRRFSVRNFDYYELSRKELEDFIDVINFAPTSMNAHPYTACMITNEEMKDKIAEILNQPHIGTCSCFAVFNIDPTALELSFTSSEDYFDRDTTFNSVITAVGDASIGAAALHDYAIMNGFGCCYIGAVKWKMLEIQKVLNLPSNVIPILGLCIGKTSEKPNIKPRLNKTFKNGDYSRSELAFRMDKYDTLMDMYYKDKYPEKESLAFFKHIHTAHTLNYRRVKGINYSQINNIPNLFVGRILAHKNNKK